MAGSDAPLEDPVEPDAPKAEAAISSDAMLLGVWLPFEASPVPAPVAVLPSFSAASVVLTADDPKLEEPAGSVDAAPAKTNNFSRVDYFTAGRRATPGLGHSPIFAGSFAHGELLADPTGSPETPLPTLIPETGKTTVVAASAADFTFKLAGRSLLPEAPAASRLPFASLVDAEIAAPGFTPSVATFDPAQPTRAGVRFASVQAGEAISLEAEGLAPTISTGPAVPAMAGENVEGANRTLARPSNHRLAAQRTTAGANIAVPLTPPPEGVTGSLGETDIKFLNSDKQIDIESPPALGIDVAKPGDIMLAPTFHRSTAGSLDINAHGLTAERGGEVPHGPESSASADAHHAIDAVLSAAERLSSTRQGVNLQFAFPGADLAVRLEMRAGELHATFRTDSPELRAALASQWQAAAANDSASPLRMVEPVFSASDKTNTGNLGSEQSPSHQHRESQARESSRSELPGASRGNPRESAAVGVVSEPRGTRVLVGSNQHLHAFA